MSLLLGTLKSKFGFIRRFRDMSLDELDFKVAENDYMLEDLDDEIDEFVSSGKSSDVISKKRVRKEDNRKEIINTYISQEKILETDFGMACANTEQITMESDEEPSLVPISFETLIKTKEPSLESTSLDELIEEEPRLEEAKPEREPSSDLTFDVKFEEFPELVQSPPLLSEHESSLEEIFEELEYMYTEHRDLVVQSDGFISTPLHALKLLGRKFNETIHNEVTLVSHDDLEKPLVRVEIIVGVFRGVGESFYKRMAAQMAALDLLLRLERLGSKSHIVPFAIFPGWRIGSRVFQHLMQICQRNGLKLPRYTTKSNISNPEKPVSSVECYIGNSSIGHGESDLTFVARKLAAYQAIEALTGEKYPLEYVALGSACMSYSELVQTGYSPAVSPVKTQWILDASAGDVNQSSSSTIVNNQELDALQQEVYDSELQEIKRRKKEFTITIRPNTTQSSDRSVVMK